MVIATFVFEFEDLPIVKEGQAVAGLVEGRAKMGLHADGTVQVLEMALNGFVQTRIAAVIREDAAAIIIDVDSRLGAILSGRLLDEHRQEMLERCMEHRKDWKNSLQEPTQ